MTSKIEATAALRAKVPKQAWLACGGLATLGLTISVFFGYLIAKQIDIDERFKNHRQTAVGVVTDLKYVKTRKEGYWQPRVTLATNSLGKIEIDDVYLRIPANANAGAILKNQYVGRTVEVEYLSALSSIRVASSYSNDRENQLGYGVLLVSLGVLLFMPLVLVWWKPRWAIPKESERVRNTSESQLRKRRRR
jgi:hypothetical protein